MSERYNPKKVRRARIAAIAKGAPADPVLVVAARQVTGTGTFEGSGVVVFNDLTCRLHGQPWRTCTLCSTKRSS